MSTSLYKISRNSPRMWHHVDAKDQIVGRLAAQIVTRLIGKNKPIYHEQADCGDYVVVTNASKLVFTGDKPTDKVYRWHSGWMGGLKTRTVQQQMAKDPSLIIYNAVRGFLPKNNLRWTRLDRLKIYNGEAYPEKELVKQSAKFGHTYHNFTNNFVDVAPQLKKSNFRGFNITDSEDVIKKKMAKYTEEEKAQYMKQKEEFMQQYDKNLDELETEAIAYKMIRSLHVAARVVELEKKDIAALEKDDSNANNHELK